jgi:hypothetical protein
MRGVGVNLEEGEQYVWEAQEGEKARGAEREAGDSGGGDAR